jgi:integrase
LETEGFVNTVKRQPRVKIADNLFKIGSVYYYRKGDFEERLGEYKSDKVALDAKRIYEMLRDRLGAESFRWRVKDLWPKYYATRVQQFKGVLEGRRPIRKKTFDEIGHVWEKHLRKFFANKKLSDIDAVMWNQYCKQSTVADLANHRKVFGGFLRWCEGEGRIKYIPAMAIPAIVRRKRKRIPPAHAKLIVEHANETLLLFVMQYLYMLLRRSEQVRAEWSHYNFDEDWVIIPDDNTRTRTGRVVTLNPLVKALLLRRKEKQRQAGIISPYVFPKRFKHDDHMTETALGRYWGETLEKAGLTSFGYEPHDLRATGEHEASKDTRFTDTQREKFAGASMQTQKRIYLQGYMAEDVRGLEAVVDFEGIEELIQSRTGQNFRAGKITGKGQR